MGKVVLSAAIMDLCHRGHLNLLRKLRDEAGDGLVIMVLHDDKSCYEIKGKFPIQSLDHRTRNVLLTGLVDMVVPTYETEPINEFHNIISKYGADNITFMRGDDNLEYPGKSIIDEHGIQTKFIPYTDGVSSTKLRDELL